MMALAVAPRRAGVVLGKDPFERGVLLLDLDHRRVDHLADGRLLRLGLERRPAGILGYPEDVLGEVLVAVLGVGVRLGLEGVVPLLEGVGDVLKENQPQRDVLVLGRAHLAPHLVRRRLELLLESKVRPAVVLPGGSTPFSAP
jgi:hypothetical protein